MPEVPVPVLEFCVGGLRGRSSCEMSQCGSLSQVSVGGLSPPTERGGISGGVCLGEVSQWGSLFVLSQVTVSNLCVLSLCRALSVGLPMSGLTTTRGRRQANGLVLSCVMFFHQNRYLSMALPLIGAWSPHPVPPTPRSHLLVHYEDPAAARLRVPTLCHTFLCS